MAKKLVESKIKESRGVDLFDVDNLEQASNLLELNWQFRASRSLMTAHQLGFFEALRKPGKAAGVAKKCGSDVPMTEKLLTVCCALGVLKRDGEIFSLNKLAADLFLPESSRYAGGTLDHNEMLWWGATGLPQVVRTGKRSSAPPPPEHFQKHMFEHWIWAMHGIAANGPAQWLASQLDLSDRKLMLDVAGGPGTYSIAICQRFPDLEAVVWDLPDTLIITRKLIDQFGMKERIKVQKGDWHKDEFGAGYDCLLLSNVLHGPASQAEVRLKQARRALQPEGLLIVHDFLMDNDRSGPLPAALFNLWLGAYTVNELIDVVRRAGFKDVSLIASNPHRGSGLVTGKRPAR